MKRKFKFIFLCIVNFIFLTTFAQNEERRWAIYANIGPTFLSKNTSYKDAFGVDNGTTESLGVEYFIPQSHFSTCLLYKNETISILGQEVQAEHEQLSLGGRWYPVPEEWLFQPHLGVNLDVLLSSDNTSSVTGSFNGRVFAYEASIKSPKLAFSPNIGFDFYMLSSVAFTAEYSYGLALGSKYTINDVTTEVNSTRICKGNLNHHSLNFGLKITFPFHFTSDDVDSLIGTLINSSYTKTRNILDRY